MFDIEKIKETINNFEFCYALFFDRTGIYFIYTIKALKF